MWIKKATAKIFFCIFFQSPHEVDMKNVVECPREFIAYFNALEAPRKLQEISGQKSLQYFHCYFGQNDDTKKIFQN